MRDILRRQQLSWSILSAIEIDSQEMLKKKELPKSTAAVDVFLMQQDGTWVVKKCVTFEMKYCVGRRCYAGHD